MTGLLWRDDAYLKTAEATVTGLTDAGGVIVNTPLFYARGGGQPGDQGHVRWDGGAARVADTVKSESGATVLILAEGDPTPPDGVSLTQEIDWSLRHRHMRMHTGLHLLSVAIPLAVTGGSIGAEKGRLDFNMPEAPEDKPALEAALNELIGRDLPVTESWITDAELAANPALVKTMSVQPPTGQGHVRLIRIGDGDAQVDLQPCGGTHVATTAEIGNLRIGKIEKKGRQNRRVYVHLEDPTA